MSRARRDTHHSEPTPSNRVEMKSKLALLGAGWLFHTHQFDHLHVLRAVMDTPGRTVLRQIKKAALHKDSPARIIGIRPDGALRLFIHRALNGERRTGEL